MYRKQKSHNKSIMYYIGIHRSCDICHYAKCAYRVRIYSINDLLIDVGTIKYNALL